MPTIRAGLLRSLRESGVNVKDIEVIGPDSRLLEDSAVREFVFQLRKLGADALIVEANDQTVVVARHIYDDVCLVAVCEPGVNGSLVARHIQLYVASGQGMTEPAPMLPVEEVRRAIGRWERQIAHLFGRQYATRLLARSMGGKSYGAMDRADMDVLRSRLSSATGGCIDFTES